MPIRDTTIIIKGSKLFLPYRKVMFDMDDIVDMLFIGGSFSYTSKERGVMDLTDPYDSLEIYEAMKFYLETAPEPAHVKKTISIPSVLNEDLLDKMSWIRLERGRWVFHNAEEDKVKSFVDSDFFRTQLEGILNPNLCKLDSHSYSGELLPQWVYFKEEDVYINTATKSNVSEHYKRDRSSTFLTGYF